jgi:hypothetical protein
VSAKCPNSTNCTDNGRCHFAPCLCKASYFGPSCEFMFAAVVLNSVPTVVINGFNSTTINLSSFVLSGNPPVQFRFQDVGTDASVNFYFNCLTLKEYTGQINITRAVASLETYNYMIIVSNPVSSANLKITIQVPPSYNATAVWTRSHQYLPSTVAHILEYSGNATSANVTIIIWIDRSVRTSLPADARGQFRGSFEVPSNSFGGRLQIAASHPAVALAPTTNDQTFIGQIQISFSESIYSLQATIPIFFSSFVTIQNQGDFDLTNLTFALSNNLHGAYNLTILPSYVGLLSAFANTSLGLSMLLHCSTPPQSIMLSTGESRVGWLASSSFIVRSQWSCLAKNNCNAHGSCVSHETCSCFVWYTGDSCQQCSPNLFAYPSCNPCPTRVRGRPVCTSSDAFCDCLNSTRVHGSPCQHCHIGYYGADCETIATITSIAPTSGLVLANQTVVTLCGDHLQNVSSFCRLNTVNRTRLIPANFISSQHMTCVFPSHPAECVRVQLVHNNSLVFSEVDLAYRYLPSCLVTDCNQGRCVMGSCRCWSPCFGMNCSSLPIPPILTSIPNVSLNEMSSSLNVNLSQYLVQEDSPLFWSLSGQVPTGLILDSTSSLLTWPSAVASPSSYRITVIARQNSTGNSSQQNLTIVMPLSYSVSIRFEQSQQVLTQARRVTINGQLHSLVNSIVSQKNRTANIRILIVGTRRNLPTVLIRVGSNVFTAVYSPLTYECRTLFVGATHSAIASSNDLPQDQVTLLGINTQKLTSKALQIRLSGNQTNRFSAIALLLNPCNHTISNLTLILIKPLMAVSFFNFSSPNCILSTILPLTACSIDLVIRFNTTGTGSLVFALRNGVFREVTHTYSINVVADRANFYINPSSSSLLAPRNSHQTLLITVYNTGSFRQGPMPAGLPNQTYVSVITPDIATIAESANASLTLFIQIPDSAPLSSFNLIGSIVDQTHSISRPFNLYLTIVGSNNTLFDLNFVYKDEFSYCATNPTDLANVTITIFSNVMNIRHVLRSNATRQTTVSLVASTYEVTAQALKHRSWTNIITIDGKSNRDWLIFLQRVLASYNFFVKEVSVDESYTFTVEAQFVAFVPAPVLVVSPTVVDIDELEANENITQIDLTFMNHGLIRVNNLQLQLPKFHSNLRFTVRRLPIGDVEANSSIIVAVSIERIGMRRVQRAYFISEAANYLASYICDGLRTIGAQLPVFTRKTDPTPCIIRFGYCREDDDDDEEWFTNDGGWDIGDGGLRVEGSFSSIQIKMPTCQSCISSSLECLIELIPGVDVADQCRKFIAFEKSAGMQ